MMEVGEEEIAICHYEPGVTPVPSDSPPADDQLASALQDRIRSGEALKRYEPAILPLNSYPSADNLLDELLGDIRRSRTASLASSPSAFSSDCENDPFEPRNQTAAELRRMGKLY